MLKHIMMSMLVGLVLTVASYVTGLYMGWITTINYLEAFAVFTSYSCEYLCIVQSRSNYPIGAISTVALSVLFYQSGLYSSMILNMYLAPTLVWGYIRWKPDHATRPVSHVDLKWWPVYIALTGIVWYALSTISSSMGASLALMDSSILAMSILAQFLLDQKKLENWLMWILVNIVSIVTYWQAGLFIVSMQYMFFLLNAFVGYYAWYRTYKNPIQEKVND
jgi:nicotinamide mononucleotide transporter